MSTINIAIDRDLKSNLDSIKLVPNETYDHIVKRLLKSYLDNCVKDVEELIPTNIQE